MQVSTGIALLLTRSRSVFHTYSLRTCETTRRRPIAQTCVPNCGIDTTIRLVHVVSVALAVLLIASNVMAQLTMVTHDCNSAMS